MYTIYKEGKCTSLSFPVHLSTVLLSSLLRAIVVSSKTLVDCSLQWIHQQRRKKSNGR